MHKLSAKDNENFEYLKQKIGQKLAPFKQKVYFRTKIKRKRTNNKCLLNIFNVVRVYRKGREIKKIY